MDKWKFGADVDGFGIFKREGCLNTEVDGEFGVLGGVLVGVLCSEEEWDWNDCMIDVRFGVLNDKAGVFDVEATGVTTLRDGWDTGESWFHE